MDVTGILNTDARASCTSSADIHLNIGKHSGKQAHHTWNFLDFLDYAVFRHDSSMSLGLLVSLSTTLVQTQTLQLLNRLPWSLQMSMVLYIFSDDFGWLFFLAPLSLVLIDVNCHEFWETFILSSGEIIVFCWSSLHFLCGATVKATLCKFFLP